VQYNNYLHGKRYIITTLDWIASLSLTWSSPLSFHLCGRLMWPKVFHFVWVYTRRYGLPKWDWLVTNHQPTWNKQQKRDFLHTCLECDWNPQFQTFDCPVTMIRSESAVYSSSIKFAAALMAVWYHTRTCTVLMLIHTHTRRAWCQKCGNLVQDWII
jgi:hypothetical protein